MPRMPQKTNGSAWLPAISGGKLLSIGAEAALNARSRAVSVDMSRHLDAVATQAGEVGQRELKKRELVAYILKLIEHDGGRFDGVDFDQRTLNDEARDLIVSMMEGRHHDLLARWAALHGAKHKDPPYVLISIRRLAAWCSLELQSAHHRDGIRDRREAMTVAADLVNQAECYRERSGALVEVSTEMVGEWRKGLTPEERREAKEHGRTVSVDEILKRYRLLLQSYGGSRAGTVEMMDAMA